jgi:hypothetical protein
MRRVRGAGEVTGKLGEGARVMAEVEVGDVAGCWTRDVEMLFTGLALVVGKGYGDRGRGVLRTMLWQEVFGASSRALTKRGVAR